MLKTAILVGTHSGCGKTTVMLALLQHLKAKQIAIATFKAGPDYLDPLWHQAITHKPSFNLDTQMMGAKVCRDQLTRQAQNVQFALIEGVMGLFDGRAGVGGMGSSADLAKELNISAILIIDGKGMAGSIVPLVAGFCQYAKKIGFTISAIIGNQIGGEHHAAILRDLLTAHKLPPLLAWLEKDAPMLPERHLGLKRPEEGDVPDFMPFLHVDDSFWDKAFTQLLDQKTSTDSTRVPLLKGKTIAVAKDPACCFIYPANINWLKEEGADIKFFSPLRSEPIPDGADALWLPGGYPELYAPILSQSKSWASLHQFVSENKPVLAECGGAMLLGKELVDLEGNRWPMAGVFPYSSIMEKRLMSLGYRDEENGMHGHEFHYSRRENTSGLMPCFKVKKGDKGTRFRNVRASYIHWYFSSAPKQMAEWLS